MFTLKSTLRFPHTLTLFLFAAVFAHGFTGSGTEDSPYLITNSDEWGEFVTAVNSGNTFQGEYVALGNNITATTTVGDAEGHFFAGTFDGGNYTITASITADGTKQGTSLFRYIWGATIKNLTVAGTITGVSNDASHTAALVGFVWNGEANPDGATESIIENVTVSATVQSGNHVGGFIGHGKVSTITFRNCVFSGTIKFGSQYAGGFLGWQSPGSTLNIDNCLFKGTFITSGQGYHPLAVKNGGYEVVSSANKAYYTTPPSGSLSGHTFINGELVYSSLPNNSLAKKVTAADNNTYYQYSNTSPAFTIETVYPIEDAPITPLPTVTYEGATLTLGEDYTVIYKAEGSEDELTEISASGNYTMVISGIGNFDGTKTQAITVVEKLKGDGSEESPYEIATEGDWIVFAQRVSQGENFSGKYLELMADISVTTMVGTSANKFSGTFDGGENTIEVSYLNFTEEYAAPFRYVNSATIKNLHTTGSISTSKKYAAGIASSAEGNSIFNNCHSNVTISSTVSGDGTHGGLVAYAKGNASNTITITDSYFDGSILGSNTSHSGGLVGWTYAKVVLENCLFKPQEITVKSNESRTFARATDYSYLTLTNCYYTQAFGTVQGTQVYANFPDHGDLYTKVKAADNVDYYIAMAATVSVNAIYNPGTLAGSVTPVVQIGNQELENVTDYTYAITKGETPIGDDYALDEGEYTVTVTGTEDTYYGTITTTFQVVHELQGDGTEGNPYQITSNEDWDIFAQRVKFGTTYSEKFVQLTNDISVSTMVGFVSDGDTSRFLGTFDGGHHAITVNYGSSNAPVGSSAAPFSYVSGATIKNLQTSGTIYTNGQYAGGIVGAGASVTIDNCSSGIAINGQKGSDDAHGGLVGTVTAGTLTIRDSYFNGQLLGNNVKNVGGLVGWIASSATLTNCLFNPAGKSSSANSSGATLYRAKTPANVTVSGCYYTEPLNTVQGQFVTKTPTDGMIYKIDQITAADGEDYYLVAAISGFQDTYVITDNLEISPVLTVNGTPLTKGADYTVTFNAPLNGVYAITVEGIGDYQGSYITTASFIGKFQGEGTEDSPYIIASVLDWEAVVDLVAQGNTFSGKFLKMTEDISSITNMIGSDSTTHYFAGTFDGDGHTLTIAIGNSNYLTDTYAGPFRFINGATIKNLHVDGSLHIKTTGYSPYYGIHAAGLVGYAKGNSLLINNRISVNVTAHASGYVGGSHGGIVGAVGADASITIKDCVFDGSMLGVGSSNINWNGGFIGWVNTNATQTTIENSLFNPSSLTMGSYASSVFNRGLAATITNCYYTSTYFEKPQGISGVGKSAAELAELLGYAWQVDGSGKVVPIPNVYETRYGAVTVVEADGNTTAYIDGSYTGTEAVEIEDPIAVNAVVFNRTFTEGKFSTIVLPFDVSLANNNVEGAEFYTITNITKDPSTNSWKNAEITKVAENSTLAANTPYLVNPTATNLVFHSGAALQTGSGIPSAAVGDEWQFRGTYNYIAFTDSAQLLGRAYGFAAQEQDGYTVGQFAKAGSGAWIPAMRAYLVYNSGSSAGKSAVGGSSLAELPETMDVVVVDRGENGEVSKKVIGTVDTRTGEFRMDRWYDMQGRKLNGKPSSKGTYYHNGKSVTIK